MSHGTRIGSRFKVQIIKVIVRGTLRVYSGKLLADQADTEVGFGYMQSCRAVGVNVIALLLHDYPLYTADHTQTMIRP